MRLHHVALLVAAALAVNVHGRHAAPDAVNLSLEQKSVKVLDHANAADKSQRFLASEDKDVPLMVTSPEHLTAAVQEGGVHRQLLSQEGNEHSSEDRSLFSILRRRKKRKRRGFKMLRKHLKENSKDRRERRKMKRRQYWERKRLLRKQHKRRGY